MVDRRVILGIVVVAAVALITTGVLVAVHILQPDRPDYRRLSLAWSFQTKRSDLVEGLAFGAGNILAVSGPLDSGDEQGVAAYDVTTHQRTATIPCPDARSVAISGRLLAIAGTCEQDDSGVRLWDLNTNRLISALPTGDETYIWLRFRPDGSELAAGGTGAPGNGAVVGVWNTATHRIVDQLAGDPMLNVDAIDLSPDGRTLVAAENDGAPGADHNLVELWDTTTGRRIGTLSHQETNTAAFSPDGGTVAVATRRDIVQLWKVRTRQLVTTMVSDPKYGTASFWAEAFSPDGTVLAAVDFNGDLTLWDVASGQVISTLSCHCAPEHVGLTTVAFSPDGRYLAAGGEGDTVDVWRAS